MTQTYGYVLKALIVTDKEESEPFANSYKFDEMPLEEALSDETFDELYGIYLKERIVK